MRASRTMRPRPTDADLLDIGNTDPREVILTLRDEIIYLRRELRALKGIPHEPLSRSVSVPTLPAPDEDSHE